MNDPSRMPAAAATITSKATIGRREAAEQVVGLADARGAQDGREAGLVVADHGAGDEGHD
jgi:hypothetical protein